MPLTIVTPPTSEPITYKQAKQQINLDDDCHRDWITDHIRTARNRAENQTGLFLISRDVSDTWQPRENDIGFSYYDLYQSNRFTLSGSPVSSITSAVDANGTIDPSNYFLNQAGNRFTICFTTSPKFPLTVTYVAGYGEASQVPDAIKGLMLTDIAQMWSYRDFSGKQPDYDAIYAAYKTGGIVG